MNIQQEKVHRGWTLYKLSNDNRMAVHLLNYGGIITKITVPDSNGKIENVVLGYKDLKDYETNSNYLGAIVGRVAGRIQDAACTLNGEKYVLEANEGTNHLHGGRNGLHSIVWNATPFQQENLVGVKLSCTRLEEDDGYPGNVQITVTYTLTNDNTLHLQYEAMSEQDTVLTLTNHSYFNLSGDLKSTIEDHTISIKSSKVVELNEHLIPTGKLLEVKDTPFDFQKSQKLHVGMSSKHIQNRIAGNGYDHYFLFDKSTNDVVNVLDESSGRMLNIITNQPGMVMYTSNTMGEELVLNEGRSRKYLGVCFETQSSPASLQHNHLPSIYLKANEAYHQQTSFEFLTKRINE
ncbi:aldose epimerase family protein [Sutcliffiella cohnii]